LEDEAVAAADIIGEVSDADVLTTSLHVVEALVILATTTAEVG
jgi:hypothetical protein